MEIHEYLRKKLGSQKFRLLYKNSDLKERVKSLASQINQDFEDSHPLIIMGVLKGSFIFIADLVRELTIPVQIEFISASSYVNTKSSGTVSIKEFSLPNLRGKHVLIVEDIIDSGLTIQSLLEHIQSKEAASVKVCSLFLKILKNQKPVIEIDYVGFTLHEGFIVGYGLDCDQKYRELPHIIEILGEP